MKKLSTLLITAFALVLGLTQCKKKVDTIATPSDLGKTVYITVNVGDGDRHIVYPGTGAVVYTDGDIIYVGDGSKYLGSLEYESGAFSGNITEPAEGAYLYFYFLGGIEISPVAATKSYEISIANQSSKLPVLSFGRSTSTYTTSTATYGCTLLNKCGLVKFTLATATSATVKVTGMKTGVTVNFADPEKAIVANGTRDAITLRNEGTDSERWAILLPQNAVTGGIAKIGENFYSCDVAAVAENSYITTNTIDNTTPTKVFTVSTDGNVVRFSPGNLQYKSGEGWRFAEHQWDICQSTNGTWNTSDWVDLFGFGTWGEGKNPLNTSTDYADYQWSTDFQGTLGGHNDWYTLSTAEWQHLFNSRTNASSLYGSATVNSVHGIVVLPDNWTLPSGSSFTAGMSGWGNNTYDTSAWATMEGAGAVFLPAAGFRGGTDVSGVGEFGNYWSTDYDEDKAYALSFFEFSVNPESNGSRFYGLSVRLVR